ncbi:argininosuccinate lyase [Cupriavidus alkaliphilus]|uniref:argininosuccinate lyase n=1 Tax=Cupriavidus alkaliphilus TaxID=942866 RepID=UPI000815F3E7|nr:argininosuccinate lyase [Cupriavidus alkaliphilus]PVY77870.1 argininosuccinate lyase [Cupriavidus alkaliphilus]SCB19328.1 argininosuccinate lyase [Cupriavidus alkaliphilus]
MTTTSHETLLAEARLSSPPAARLTKHYALPGLERERKQFHEFVAVDLAHVTMLVEEGIVSGETGRAILRQLLTIRQMQPSEFPVDARKGSFLLQVESYLFNAVGEDVGGQMHTGRSRIDQGATVRRLYKRNRILDVMDQLNAFQDALAEQARRHAHTIMPGYTHMQQAQPWVFGHYLLSFSSRLHDSFERLAQAYGRVNRNPLGTVGLVGTSWPLNRARTTELLGFDGQVENSKLGREAFDAADAICALSFIMADLNDLATDLHIWSSTEFGLVESDDSYSGTSSIFPQKKNPVALETIRRAAGPAVTWLGAALATFRAEGTGDQAMRSVSHIDEALATTESMLDLFTGVIETLIVHQDRMSESLKGSWCTSSNLADLIVRERRLSFRQVHHIVARAVRNCVAQALRADQLTSARLDEAALETVGVALNLGDTAVRDALDPVRFVETRITDGSVGPHQVARLLARAAQERAADQQWVRDARHRLSRAQLALDEAVGKLVA